MSTNAAPPRPTVSMAMPVCHARVCLRESVSPVLSQTLSDPEPILAHDPEAVTDERLLGRG